MNMSITINRDVLEELCKKVILAVNHYQQETFEEYINNYEEELETYRSLNWFRKFFNEEPVNPLTPGSVEHYKYKEEVYFFREVCEQAEQVVLCLSQKGLHNTTFDIDLETLASFHNATGKYTSIEHNNETGQDFVEVRDARDD